MRHYNSIRFVVLMPRGKTCKTDHFFASLVQLYPLIQTLISGKTDIVSITINDESLLFTCSITHTPSFSFHYTIYWAVASLSSVRKLVEDIRRIASRANLVCIQYPTEMASPFDNALSPLFYSRRVEVTNDSNMDYFLQLMDAMFYRVNECEAEEPTPLLEQLVNRCRRNDTALEVSYWEGERGDRRVDERPLSTEREGVRNARESVRHGRGLLGADEEARQGAGVPHAGKSAAT